MKDKVQPYLMSLRTKFEGQWFLDTLNVAVDYCARRSLEMSDKKVERT